jgi:hypothetical protein
MFHQVILAHAPSSCEPKRSSRHSAAAATRNPQAREFLSSGAESRPLARRQGVQKDSPAGRKEFERAWNGVGGARRMKSSRRSSEAGLLGPNNSAKNSWRR